MKIKSNLIYSSILTVSNFVFPVLTFPYVSRVLGVNNIGLFNWISGIIQYFIFFSMMGIGIVGIREVAKNKNNHKELNITFSSLIVLNFFTTIISLIFLFFLILLSSKFAEYKTLFFIGAANIFFNLFLIEWFFKGIENFKYITYRSIIIKAVYVLSIFLFVKSKNDYKIYYLLTVVTVIINALYNWFYSRKFVRFSIRDINLKLYFKPFIVLGIYLLFNSMYSTFNIAYLGYVGGNVEVGYYSTATKLYGILLAFFSAFTGVMLPRMSALVAEDNHSEINRLIQKSFNLLFSICFPVIIYFLFFAPQIIRITAGVGYDGAVLPMRIMMPLLLIIGIEQILIIQLLMPLNKDRAIFINSVIGAIMGVSLAIILVKNLLSVGSSIVWVCSEFSILLCANYFVKKYVGVKIPYKIIIIKLIYSIPYIIICAGILFFVKGQISMIVISLIASLAYFILDDFYLSKNLILSTFIFGNRKLNDNN